MVFTKIMFIRGMVYSVEGLTKFISDEEKKGYSSEDFLLTKAYILETTIPRLLGDFKGTLPGVYRWNCCSEICDEKILIGYHIFSLNRDPKIMNGKNKCSKCDEFTCCNDCIQIMENGEKYDVLKIDDEVCFSEDLSKKHDDELFQIHALLGKLGISYESFGTIMMLDDCMSCS